MGHHGAEPPRGKDPQAKAKIQRQITQLKCQKKESLIRRKDNIIKIQNVITNLKYVSERNKAVYSIQYIVYTLTQMTLHYHYGCYHYYHCYC